MYCLSFFDIRLTASLCTGWRARLQCGRSWVRAPIGSNQTIKLVFVASPLSTHRQGERATNWLALNQNNVSNWGDMSVSGPLF